MANIVSYKSDRLAELVAKTLLFTTHTYTHHTHTHIQERFPAGCENDSRNGQRIQMRGEWRREERMKVIEKEDEDWLSRIHTWGSKTVYTVCHQTSKRLRKPKGILVQVYNSTLNSHNKSSQSSQHWNCLSFHIRLKMLSPGSLCMLMMHCFCLITHWSRALLTEDQTLKVTAWSMLYNGEF